MERITLDEQDKRRIQKFIKQEIGFVGYEEDIELLEQNGELTETLARKVFTKIMNNAYRIRTMLEPEEDNEFRKEIEETFSKYDKIPKPQQVGKYGFYDGSYNSMELDEIYANMQIAFELKEIDSKYYGCRELRDIANAVINSIAGIEKYKIELHPETNEELQRISKELRILLSGERTDIQGIQDRVNVYNQHATNIWNDYLTDINDVENSQYRWVIHNLTKGELEGDFRNKYMSTSLMTNNVMGRYGNSAYGLIIKPKHIVSASYKDTNTLNTRDDEENLFNIRPPFMLPQEIEEICIQQTIEENGEMLNYEKTAIYSELVVDEYEIVGVYYISNGEKELAGDYERAKKVAKERGLPLVERDISKYRAEHGLEPMTERAKRNLCGTILRKCCEGDKKLQQLYSKFSKSFIDNHFQEFYEKFMQIKGKTEFSKEDILRAFSEISRGDRYFEKVSQSIDEIYLSELEREELQRLQLEKEYGLVGINDGESLKKRLEKIISDGIHYGANKEDLEGIKIFENIKKVMPQFEVFKSIYLQLREMGVEKQLYVGMDFANISYDEILERATRIVEENEKAKQVYTGNNNEEQKETIDESSNAIVEEQIEKDNGDYKINKFGEIIRENNSQSETQESVVFEEIIQPKTSKRIEQLQHEKIKQREESIKDEIGEELKNTEEQLQQKNNPKVDLWMNRFNGWYSAIDRISQNVKAKFVQMKSDIVKAITEKLKERTNNKQKNMQSQATMKGR